MGFICIRKIARHRLGACTGDVPGWRHIAAGLPCQPGTGTPKICVPRGKQLSGASVKGYGRLGSAPREKSVSPPGRLPTIKVFIRRKSPSLAPNSFISRPSVTRHVNNRCNFSRNSGELFESLSGQALWGASPLSCIYELSVGRGGKRRNNERRKGLKMGRKWVADGVAKNPECILHGLIYVERVPALQDAAGPQADVTLHVTVRAEVNRQLNSVQIDQVVS
ncbi:hypothetical protein B0H13DRAFT_1897855 [Mycena leptocephala]|nr:hypothetical protein B0H13DRAFT_1897855 [Mycena leptocephala]